MLAPTPLRTFHAQTLAFCIGARRLPARRVLRYVGLQPDRSASRLRPSPRLSRRSRRPKAQSSCPTCRPGCATACASTPRSGCPRPKASFPVVLIRTPYETEMSSVRDQAAQRRLCGHPAARARPLSLRRRDADARQRRRGRLGHARMDRRSSPGPTARLRPMAARRRRRTSSSSHRSATRRTRR